VTAESRNQFELLPNEFVIVDAAIRASSDGVGSKSLSCGRQSDHDFAIIWSAVVGLLSESRKNFGKSRKV
jgi:hypothetical protein